MPLTEIEAFLAQSLEDRRLSRNEKQALGEALGGLEREDDRLALCRRAFALAREAVADGDSRGVLDWLEDVVKLAHRRPESGAATDLAEAHFSPGDDCARRIIELFARARRTIDVCVFTITDDRISDAILDAHRRKVAIRIVTDNEKAFDEGSDVERLAAAGVALRVDRTEYHMHNKFAIFDHATLLTGSYNWTRSASRFNDENFIVTSNRALIEAFSRTFERLWARLA